MKRMMAVLILAAGVAACSGQAFDIQKPLPQSVPTIVYMDGSSGQTLMCEMTGKFGTASMSLANCSLSLGFTWEQVMTKVIRAMHQDCDFQVEHNKQEVEKLEAMLEAELARHRADLAENLRTIQALQKTFEKIRSTPNLTPQQTRAMENLQKEMAKTKAITDSILAKKPND